MGFKFVRLMLETEIGLQKLVMKLDFVDIREGRKTCFSFRADQNYSKFHVYHWIHLSLNHCYMNLNLSNVIKFLVYM